MSDNFALALLSLCAVINSYLIHPRLLEDSTHPLWTQITNDLCSIYPSHLWPTAQWRIYRSATDRNPLLELAGAQDSTTDDSVLGDEFEQLGDDKVQEPEHHEANTTITDSHSIQVITDFAILAPVFQPCPTLFANPATKILDGLKSGLQLLECAPTDWHSFVQNMTLQQLMVLGIVELKCPPHRSFSNIVSYCKDVHGNIKAAHRQLVQQALCLFSSPKYSKQNHVIALAGAGEWWSFSIISRQYIQKTFGAFSERRFELSKGLEGLGSEKDPVVIEEELARIVPIADVAASASKLEEAVANRTRARTQATLAQAARQNQDGGRLFTPEGFNNFIKETPGPYFSDSDLATLRQYIHHGLCYQYATSPDFPFGIEQPGEDMVAFDKLVDMQWSPILRLGSKTSNKYMDQIKDKLKNAAIQEHF